MCFSVGDVQSDILHQIWAYFIRMKLQYLLYTEAKVSLRFSQLRLFSHFKYISPIYFLFEDYSNTMVFEKLIRDAIRSIYSRCCWNKIWFECPTLSDIRLAFAACRLPKTYRVFIDFKTIFCNHRLHGHIITVS